MRSQADWLEACQWVQAHAPPGARALTPRGSQSFKWNAQRAEVVNWKDVAQDTQTLIAWHDRYFDVYWQPETEGSRLPYGSLAQQGADRLRQLASRYGADYVVTAEYPPLALPILYSNATYTVYDCQPPTMTEKP